MTNGISLDALPGQLCARGSKTASVLGTILRPGNGVKKRGGAEAIGAQNIFDVDPNGAFEFMKSVVEGNDRAVGQVRRKQVEVLFGAGVGVVAVDPEQTDGAAPSLRHLAGGRAMHLDMLLDSSAADVRHEFIEGRRFSAEHGIGDGGCGVRIDADHRTKSVVRGERRQTHHGLAFEAADLDDHAGAGRTGGEQAEGAEFELANVAGNVMRALPGGVDYGFEIGGQRKVRHSF